MTSIAPYSDERKVLVGSMAEWQSTGKIVYWTHHTLAARVSAWGENNSLTKSSTGSYGMES